MVQGVQKSLSDHNTRYAPLGEILTGTLATVSFPLNWERVPPPSNDAGTVVAVPLTPLLLPQGTPFDGYLFKTGDCYRLLCLSVVCLLVCTFVSYAN